MSMLDGVSQCWPLAKSCVVWWDAWAAVGAALAVVATIVLGAFTYRLGSAANAATRVAVQISVREFERQQLRDDKERLLVLVQIAGEVSLNLDKIRRISEYINQPNFDAIFLNDIPATHLLLTTLSTVTFPAIASVTERLHYLEPVVGARVVRVMGLFISMREIRPNLDDRQDLAEGLRILQLMLPRAVNDLEAIWGTSMAAVHELGLDDHEFALAMAGKPSE